MLTWYAASNLYTITASAGPVHFRLTPKNTQEPFGQCWLDISYENEVICELHDSSEEAKESAVRFARARNAEADLYNGAAAAK